MKFIEHIKSILEISKSLFYISFFIDLECLKAIRDILKIQR